MLKIKKFIFNPFQENTYLVWDVESKEALVIDPGCYNENEESQIIEFIIKENLILKYLINTHCHIDHVLGNAFIKNKFNCTFFAPELDMPLLNNLMSQSELFGFKAAKSPTPDKFITEDLKLNLGENYFTFLFTPGHTAGEFSILFDNFCFSGDVLFLDGIGRTDLPGGDYNTLINSIIKKLLVLPDNTEVFPGHGDKTTIGYEKLNNPFLN
ncbi:MAG: MBL fold metallo-hydrolase [Ignavibacteriales bacterium]|nr:MBL fold metallo-hydrolase [Ignavibacteriales bacterium]